MHDSTPRPLAQTPMTPERKRLLFDITVWVTAPLVAFTLLAFDAYATPRHTAGATYAFAPGAASGDFHEHAVRLSR